MDSQKRFIMTHQMPLPSARREETTHRLAVRPRAAAQPDTSRLPIAPSGGRGGPYEGAPPPAKEKEEEVSVVAVDGGRAFGREAAPPKGPSASPPVAPPTVSSSKTSAAPAAAPESTRSSGGAPRRLVAADADAHRGGDVQLAPDQHQKISRKALLLRARRLRLHDLLEAEALRDKREGARRSPAPELAVTTAMIARQIQNISARERVIERAVESRLDRTREARRASPEAPPPPAAVHQQTHRVLSQHNQPAARPVVVNVLGLTRAAAPRVIRATGVHAKEEHGQILHPLILEAAVAPESYERVGGVQNRFPVVRVPPTHGAPGFNVQRAGRARTVIRSHAPLQATRQEDVGTFVHTDGARLRHDGSPPSEHPFFFHPAAHRVSTMRSPLENPPSGAAPHIVENPGRRAEQKTQRERRSWSR
jgi:hypothetical protein